jgi:sialate O-acetylesterase
MSRLVHGHLVTVLLLFSSTSALADVRLPALFTDHMVLQQGQANRVWGWAEPGEAVSVSIEKQEHKATADDKGRWTVKLDSLPAGGPHVLAVKGKNEIRVEDVLIGEVWICSGQSNMAWSVRQAADGDLEIAAAKYPQIRLISVPQVGTQELQEDFKGKWAVCSPEDVADFSAVGFFFGRRLHEALGVPVGLIDNAWGGSACEAWIRRDLLAADEKYQPLLESWDERVKNYDAERVAADFEKQLAAWREAVAKARADGQPLPQRPRPPQNPLASNHRPANIYCGVLRPTIGYGIRGVIWYQGESNAGRAYQYRDLFPLMIQSWRDEWQQGNFPFYWVQLADFKAELPEPAASDWAELREAQTMTQKLPHTGQAVIIDVGEGKDIHPKNKQTVANRLARLALARDYGRTDLAHRSPEYKSLERQGSKIVVTLDHVGGGLATFDTAEPRGFAVAGADQKFVWAKAKFVGPDKVEVSSDAVAEPVAVRYAWADNPVCNVYSKEGLPLTPFRTDDWPGVTAGVVK